MTAFSRFSVAAAWLLSLLALTACSSTTPDVYSSVAPGSDFRGIQTYGFFEEMSTDRAGYQSLETNFLKVAVAQQLDLRGMHYDPENPDVLMNFYIHTADKIRTRQTPTMSGGYYGYRGGYYTGYGYGTGYETRVDQYTEGTLTIDMIDPREKKLLWEGTLTGRLTKKDVQDMETTIDQAVKEIFFKFPVLDVTQ
jgi:hypothetical protein